MADLAQDGRCDEVVHRCHGQHVQPPEQAVDVNDGGQRDNTTGLVHRQGHIQVVVAVAEQQLGRAVCERVLMEAG